MIPDNESGPRLAPRPVSRPPVDPLATRAFGRPSGVDGPFVAEELRPAKYRRSGEFTVSEQKADPVLTEAFGRPYPGVDSLQRHPADASALDGPGGPLTEDPEDPWRDPSTGAALGNPALDRPAAAVATGPVGKLGVREVLFGGRVSSWALATCSSVLSRTGSPKAASPWVTAVKASWAVWTRR